MARSVSASSTGGNSIALFGVGRMGQALAAGWINDLDVAGLSDVTLIDPHPTEDATKLSRKSNVRLNPERKAPVSVLVLAIKPQMFEESVKQAALWTDRNTLIISVMAGISLSRMEKAFPDARCVRSMPNTPGSIGKGITGFCLGESCRKSDVQTVTKLLKPLGHVEGPLDENLLDAVTAVSGSGPAYIFLMTEALAAAGRKLGLPEDLSARLALATVTGAGALMEQPGADPGELRRAVTSPNGTTQAALDVLMKPGGLPDLMRLAAEAAANRSHDLSQDS